MGDEPQAQVRSKIAIEKALARVERALKAARDKSHEKHEQAVDAVVGMGSWSQMKLCLEDLRERVGPTLQVKIDQALKYANGIEVPQ